MALTNATNSFTTKMKTHEHHTCAYALSSHHSISFEYFRKKALYVENIIVRGTSLSENFQN